MILHVGPLARLSLRSSVASGKAEGLGYCHVPSVVAGEAPSQVPYSVRERGKGEQLDFKAKQCLVS